MSNRVRRPLLPARFRIALVAAAVTTMGPLATARVLEPAERGFGTHEQLGLAPCWIYLHMGIVCPSCGMTTSWAHASRGNLRLAAACHAGGLLLWVAALVAIPWMLTASALGRWPVVAPSPRPLLWAAAALLLVTLLDWLRRLLAA